MKTKNSADIVFVIDASDSMQPCIDGLKRHISQFVDVFKNDANSAWDIRLEFITHSVSNSTSGNDAFGISSINETAAWNSIYQPTSRGAFFTTNVSDFQTSLASISVTGDEASFLALDYALDLPWRTQSGCRKIVLLFTDEPMETGCMVSDSTKLTNALIDKIHALKAYLYLITPDSPGFEKLASADKAEWCLIDEGDGMLKVDFNKILAMPAKSITASQAPLGSSPSVQRALFGQDKWVSTNSTVRHDGV